MFTSSVPDEVRNLNTLEIKVLFDLVFLLEECEAGDIFCGSGLLKSMRDTKLYQRSVRENYEWMSHVAEVEVFEFRYTLNNVSGTYSMYSLR